MADVSFRCSVPLCSNTRSGKKMGLALSWHAIPKNKDLKREWLAKMRRDLDTKIQLRKYSKVCSLHFKKSDFHIFLTSSRTRVRLKPNVVPSIFLWSSETKNAEVPANQVQNSSHTLPTETNSEIFKQEPFEQDPFVLTPTNEPERILPDLEETPNPEETSNHTYSVETILPYQLVVPELEEIDDDDHDHNDDQNSSRFLESVKIKSKSKTKTQSTQCSIIPSLAGKKDECLIWRHDNSVMEKSLVQGPKRTVATQAGLNLQRKISMAVQCQIKPRCVDAGVQCSPKRGSVKTDTHGRNACRDATTQANLQHSCRFAEQADKSALTPLYVHLPGWLNHVFGIVEGYRSLCSVVWPNRIEVVRRDLVDVPCAGAVPCKLIVNSDGKASTVTAFRTVRASFHVSSAEKLAEELVKLSDKGRYVFCPGLDKYSDVGNGKSDLVVRVEWPCERAQSRKCLEWYAARDDVPRSAVMAGIARCSHCVRLHRCLGEEKLGLEEPVRKSVEVDSHKRTLCLTVGSPKKRKIAICDKVAEKVEVERAELGVVADDEEYDGVLRIMAAMARESTLQEVLMSDGSLKQQPPSKDQLSKWKCLAMDQKLNRVRDGTGNRWSSATTELAMEIYERSPATYHRLRYFNLLKLPCVKSLAKGDCVSGNDCEIIDPMEELFACINGTEKVNQGSDCEVVGQVEEIFILSGSSADRSNTDEDGTIN